MCGLCSNVICSSQDLVFINIDSCSNSNWRKTTDCNLTFVVFRCIFLFTIRKWNFSLGFVLLLFCHALVENNQTLVTISSSSVISQKPIGYFERLVNVSPFFSINFVFPHLFFSWFPLEEMIWYRSFVLLAKNQRPTRNRHLGWEKRERLSSLKGVDH